MRPLIAAGLAVTLAFSSCGGSSADKPERPATKEDTRRPQSAPRERVPVVPGTHPASARVVRIVRGWADELRRGHLDKASRFFSLPVVVSNSGPPQELKTRAEVRFFNLSLPCGARLLRAISGKRYTIATFELTERVGSPTGCIGTGELAATAFAFRDGKISEWRRVTVPPSSRDDAAPRVTPT